jgi:prepilin-type N-terminal cleavage/methylation domain-containing protein
MNYKIHNRNASCYGFTLIELLIVISIFIITTVLIFVNYSKFGSILSLKKTSQEIALSIREAQVYALGVKGKGLAMDVFPGYGIYFASTSPDSFLLFSDNDGNYYYSDEDEIVKEFKIETGDKIIDLCGADELGEICELDQLNIVFKRPDPIVRLNDGAGNPFSNVKIKVRSLRGGNEKIINVWISGQISVE